MSTAPDSSAALAASLSLKKVNKTSLSTGFSARQYLGLTTMRTRCPSTRSASMKGPVPAGFVSTVSMPAGSIGETNCSKSVICLSGTGWVKFSRMVKGSTTVQSFTTAMVANRFLPSLGSAAFLRVAATASAFITAPLWKVTSRRRVRVTELLPAPIDQAEARLGIA